MEDLDKEIAEKINENFAELFDKTTVSAANPTGTPGYAICNHIVGFFGNEDVAQIVRADSARGMEPHDYWKFCPECGEQIKQA
jgi:uncharacterized protein (UPF0297 family)